MDRSDITLFQANLHNDLNPDVVTSVVDINVQLDDGKRVSVAGLTEIDQDNLNDEFASQSAKYAYFAVLCAEARVTRDTAQDAYKQEQGDAFVAFKRDEDGEFSINDKPVTDGLANQLVAADDGCAQLKQEYLEAEREFRVLDALVRSLDMRANMLISLGANLRSEAEMDGMHISERNPGDAARRVLTRDKS